MKGTNVSRNAPRTFHTVVAAYRKNGLEFIEFLVWGYI